jgi:hypothetical protein
MRSFEDHVQWMRDQKFSERDIALVREQQNWFDATNAYLERIYSECPSMTGTHRPVPEKMLIPMEEAVAKAERDNPIEEEASGV